MKMEEKRKKLRPYLDKCAQDRYQFGELDCANFVSKGISIVMDKDVNKYFGWDNLTKLQLMKIVVENKGPGPLLDKVANEWGLTKLDSPHLAQFGDMVYSPRLNSLGIVDQGVLFMAPNGLCRIQIEDDMIIYRI